MNTLMFLISTSVLLGAVLGIMSCFVFSLPALTSFWIAGLTMIGLFLITLVLNNITFAWSSRSV